MSSIRSIFILAILALIALALAGCAPKMRPDVVLIVMDTVRQDHVSSYGYVRKTTPNVDRIAEDAVRFTNVHATSCWTLPSHASMLTGLYPGAHGATGANPILGPSRVTLAETFAKEGYATVAVVANAMLERAKGLDQGFDEYHEAWFSMYDDHASPVIEPNAPPTNPEDDGKPKNLFLERAKQLRPGIDENAYHQVKRVLSYRDPKKPLFLFVNLIGAHSPYNSSGSHRETFLRHPEMTIDADEWPKFYVGMLDFGGRDFEHLIDLYDAEILKVDEIVGRIVGDLEKTKRWKNTILVVTSDHGENFGDHGHVSHVFSLHESLTKVPLIIRGLKSKRGRRIDDSAVSLIDLFPTVIAAAGGQRPKGVPYGRDVTRKKGDRNPEIYLEYDPPADLFDFVEKLFGQEVGRMAKFRRGLRAVVDDGSKLIWASDGDHEYYDLTADPRETANLAAAPDRQESRQALLDKLSDFVARNESMISKPDQGSPIKRNAETLEALRGLGYVK